MCRDVHKCPFHCYDLHFAFMMVWRNVTINHSLIHMQGAHRRSLYIGFVSWLPVPGGCPNFCMVVRKPVCFNPEISTSILNDVVWYFQVNFREWKVPWMKSLIKISMKFVPKASIENKAVLVQVMAWRRTGDRPLPEPKLIQIIDAYIQH